MAPRKMAVCGALIAGTGQLLTALTDLFALLFMLRVAVGLGSALCLSAAIITISSFKQPDSTTGYVYAYVILLLAFLMYSVPWLLPDGNHRGLFSLFAVLTILGTLLLFKLPADKAYQRQNININAGSNIYRLIAIFFTGEFLLLAGVGTVWAFIERVGLASGISPHDIGLYLSLGMLVSMLGSFTGRVGRDPVRQVPAFGRRRGTYRRRQRSAPRFNGRNVLSHDDVHLSVHAVFCPALRCRNCCYNRQERAPGYRGLSRTGIQLWSRRRHRGTGS